MIAPRVTAEDRRLQQVNETNMEAGVLARDGSRELRPRPPPPVEVSRNMRAGADPTMARKPEQDSLSELRKHAEAKLAGEEAALLDASPEEMTQIVFPVTV